MSNFLKQKAIILASGSTIRFKLLASLGLNFQVKPSACNEDEIKKTHCDKPVFELGYTLAKSKALDVSHQFPNHFIIAADQLCVVGNKILDKPLNHPTAVEHLSLLSGKEHQQIACVCIAKNNELLWQYHDIATLFLRDLSAEEIEAYLQSEKPYHSCGAYQYETKGKWLFKEVRGKEDTILGLPLQPLVNALIDLGAIHLI